MEQQDLDSPKREDNDAATSGSPVPGVDNGIVRFDLPTRTPMLVPVSWLGSLQ